MPNLTRANLTVVASGLDKYIIETLIDENSSDHPATRKLLKQFADLEKHYPFTDPLGIHPPTGWTPDKVKILFELLKLGDKDDVRKILSS